MAHAEHIDPDGDFITVFIADDIGVAENGVVLYSYNEDDNNATEVIFSTRSDWRKFAEKVEEVFDEVEDEAPADRSSEDVIRELKDAVAESLSAASEQIRKLGESLKR